MSAWRFVEIECCYYLWHLSYSITHIEKKKRLLMKKECAFFPLSIEENLKKFVKSKIHF